MFMYENCKQLLQKRSFEVTLKTITTQCYLKNISSKVEGLIMGDFHTNLLDFEKKKQKIKHKKAAL